MKTECCFIQTPDDFYGNYQGNKVQLSYHISGDSCWVVVWGNDDTGMEKQVDTEQVRPLYRSLKEKGCVSKQELLALGFVTA